MRSRIGQIIDKAGCAIERAATFADRNVITAGFIVLLVAVGFLPWWGFGRVLAPLDILNELYEPWAAGDTEVNVHNHFTTNSVTQFLLYRKFAERSCSEEGFVRWNNLIAGGTPIYAQTTAAFNDWTMQLHCYLEYWNAWHIGFMGQFLIAGLGMFVFLRSQRLSPLVALLGAIAFVLNSQFVVLSQFRFLLGAFSWMPWLLWAMYRYRDGSAWAWPFVPIFMALVFLGGTLQTNAFVFFIVLCIWIAWFIELNTGTAPRFLRHFDRPLRDVGPIGSGNCGVRANTQRA